MSAEHRPWNIAGSLAPVPWSERRDLIAEPVAGMLDELGPAADGVYVAEIDPALADTAEFCAAYGSPLEASANCVVVSGKRAGEVRHAAALVLATTRADVNHTIKRRMDVRKLSFARQDEAVELTAMAYGGITPIGLPGSWPVLLAPAVAEAPELVVGSGIRGSKLLVSGKLLADLPAAEVVDGLALAD